MKKVRWGLFIFWVFLTVFLCIQDGKSSGELSGFLANFIGIEEQLLRKLAHFFVHFMLALLAYQAIVTTVKPKSTALLCSIFLSLLFAVIDESFQMVVIDRSAELKDVLINISGVITGIVVSIIAHEKSS